MSMRFVQSKLIMTLFFKITSSSIVYWLAYVDDIILCDDHGDEVKRMNAMLNSKFALRYVGLLNNFLGIEVHKLPNDDFL